MRIDLDLSDLPDPAKRGGERISAAVTIEVEGDEPCEAQAPVDFGPGWLEVRFRVRPGGPDFRFYAFRGSRFRLLASSWWACSLDRPVPVVPQNARRERSDELGYRLILEPPGAWIDYRVLIAGLSLEQSDHVLNQLFLTLPQEAHARKCF
jgi:hypothetical protein